MMTPEQIEFHRKRFEEYYRNLPSYKESEKAAMFQGYLMAIDIIEVELPKDDGSISQNAYKIDCEAHLKSQGLMVKL